MRSLVFKIILALLLSQSAIDIISFPERFKDIGTFFNYLISNPQSFPLLFGFFSLIISVVVPMLSLIGIAIYIFTKNNLNAWLIMAIILSVQLYIYSHVLYVLQIAPFPFTTAGFEDYTILVSEIVSTCFFILVVFYFVPRYLKQLETKPVIDVSDNSYIRFKNYLYDSGLILYLTISTLALLADSNKNISHYEIFLVFTMTKFCYYFSTEFLFRRTFGKIITRTFVQSKNNSFRNITIRSLCRHIPLEPFSFFFKPAGRWHDKLSNTQIIKY